MTMSRQSDRALIEDPVSELLISWQEHRQQGKDLTAADLCAGHPEYVDEITQHIAALRAMEAVLDVGGDTSDATPSAIRPMSGPVLDLPGFEILDILGEGGMGVVYKARQLRPSRLVAIKMILAGPHARPEQLARFRTEAEAAAQLRHPNIVPIFEVGEFERQPFFTMEYVEGGNLAQRLAKGLLPAREAASLLKTVAEAVQFAHERDIIHRDLKPGNILLHTEDGALPDSRLPVPKITDFGLAKRLDGNGEQTQTGAVLGTPCYLAPEQAAGKNRDIGPAADVYSLGAMLYESLTGRPPFQGESTLDTLEQVRSREPVSLRRLRPNIPNDLETICLKCLEKQPSRRYGSAAELAADLGRFLAGEPIQARRTPLWEQALKWARRKPAQAGLITISCLSAAALLGVWAMFTNELRFERDRAWELEKDAREQAQLAQDHKAEAERERTSAWRQRDEVRDLNSYTQILLKRCQDEVRQHIDATLDAKQARTASGEPGALFYVLARSYAMTAAAYRKDTALRPADGQKQADYYAGSAVELLQKAVERGYLNSTDYRDRLRNDKDLDELRTREDFQRLLKHLRIGQPE
jgi:serine/threonine protein kinase